MSGEGAPSAGGADGADLDAAVAALRSHGCRLTAEGVDAVEPARDPANALARALDLDLKEIGASAFPEEFGKSGAKCETLDEPLLLQIQKVRNIAAPKANEHSKRSPRMLKLTLTDGHSTCQAIEIDFVPGLSVDTPPGTKIQLSGGPVTVSHGYVFVGPSNVKVYGGHVPHMVEKWELNRTLAKHTRVCTGGDGAPPPWIPFGQRLEGRDLRDEFKAVQDAVKFSNAEFEAQRKGAIAEAQKLSGTKKVFGGGTKPMLDANVQKIVDAGFTEEQAENALRISKNNVDKALKNLQKCTGENKKERIGKEPSKNRKNRNKESVDDDGINSLKPTAKLSLFDFLEDKLPMVAEFEKTVKSHEANSYKEDNKHEKNNFERKGQNKGTSKTTRSFNTRQQSSQVTNQSNKNDYSQFHNPYWQNENQKNYNYSKEERSQHSYSQPIINEKPPRFQRKQEGEMKKHQNINVTQEPNYPQNYHSQLQSNFYPNKRNVVDNRLRGLYNQSLDNVTNATAAMNLDIHVQIKYNNMQNLQNFHNNYSYTTKTNYNQNYLNDSYKRNNQYQINKGQITIPNGQNIGQSFYGHYSENQTKDNHINSDQSALLNTLQQSNNQSHDHQNMYNYRGNGFYQPNSIVGFQNATINEQARKMLAEGTEINWSVGDRCLAKYWEDNGYYEAEITGVSARTVVVRFLVYGNHEEVLRSDCILPETNRQFGREATINRNENNGRAGRFHQPMYVPPAQRKA